MILTIYFGLVIISIILIIMGYAIPGQVEIFKYAGFGFLFMLGVMMIPGTPGDIEYKIGQTEIFNNETSTTTINDNYSTYDNSFYGIYIALASIFGFISVFLTQKQVSFEND